MRIRWNFVLSFIFFSFTFNSALVFSEEESRLKKLLALRKMNILENLGLASGLRNLFGEDTRKPNHYDPSAPMGVWIPYDYPLPSR